QLDCELVELAGETERYLVVAVHRRARIDSDIKGLINRHDSRDGVRDHLAIDFFAVNGQNTRAAFPQACAVILEIEHDRMFTGRERLLAFPSETFQGKQIIGEHRSALEQIEPVTSKAAA